MGNRKSNNKGNNKGNNKQKNAVQGIKNENYNVSQKKMIEIQAEAYYRAMKRIETEKAEPKECKHEKKKYKWYENVLFVLNVLFWPWKIHKKFSVSSRIYDSILVLFVSGTLKFAGGMMWLFGILAIIYEIWQMISKRGVDELISVIPIIVFSLFLGSTFVLAGEEFGKETDSNKIYAYSASVIALISCVVGIITLIGI